MRGALPATLLHRTLEINAKNVMITAKSVMEAPTIAQHAPRSKSSLW